MDFKDQIKQLGERVANLKEQTNTEEATKNAFVMPFLNALGYDVFNPLEVVPEYVTDIGTKKGEKIDYAIFRDGHPSILVECKHWNQNLNLHDNQLLRYFHVSKAKFGLLTNGIEYRFYSDLVSPNIMDEKPFLSFNITDMKETTVDELKKFHKSYFNVENIITTAGEMKYMNELKGLIHIEMSEPTAEFVEYFARKVYSNGRITGKIVEQFTPLVKKSAQQYISDLITERLKSALVKESQSEQDSVPTETNSVEVEGKKIETTQDEIEGFMIVKTIIRQKVDASRIFYRDGQAYCSVILDDNRLKPICRLYFNGNKKFISIIDDQKKEVKNEIQTIDDIFKFANELLQTAVSYDKSKETV